ncbi:MAG: hypothetical protein ACTSQY_06530 [Candidatus Odinarchaeia archaeon]
MSNVFFKPDVIEKIIHLTSSTDKEAGGFLVGYTKGNALFVNDAFFAEQVSSHVSVKLDFSSQLDVLKQLQNKNNNLSICGWFHSHPGMGADFMSQTDIKTQVIYQNLFAKAIALIIDPIRYKETGNFDDKTLKIYRVKNNKPVNVKLQLDVEPRELLSYLIAGTPPKHVVKTEEFTEKDVRIPVTLEDLRELRKNMLYTILGWNFIALSILVVFLFFIINVI